MQGLVKKATRGIKLLLANPRGFWVKLKPLICRAESGMIKINGVNFNIDLDLDPAMRNMYFGSYEYELTCLLRKYLRPGDTFIDIGGNVGYISAFALGLVGKSGNVHTFEPVPQYLTRLRRVQADNPGHNLQVNGVALGESGGTAKIAVTNRRNIGWNTMVPDFMTRDTIGEEIEIDVITLTDYLAARDVQNLRLVKIDTEGFEFPVMKGFQEYLRRLPELPVLIIEVAPAAYPKLKTDLGEFARFMTTLGYAPRSVEGGRAVALEKLASTTDVVFIPRSK